MGLIVILDDVFLVGRLFDHVHIQIVNVNSLPIIQRVNTATTVSALCVIDVRPYSLPKSNENGASDFANHVGSHPLNVKRKGVLGYS